MEAVRRGESLRAVAEAQGVALSTVQYWVDRAQSQALESVEWESRAPGPKESSGRFARELDDQVLAARQHLREVDALGYCGAAAIRDRLLALGLASVPSERTINRILKRHGVFDSSVRRRWPAPPRGWYLPGVADGLWEVDLWDRVQGLLIQDGPQVEVLNVVSLHGSVAGSWPQENLTSVRVRECLIEHWRRWGLPQYAQFDNDTLFQGPHQHPDAVGSVSRLCLSLGVVPVFVPPREFGFQAAIERYNGDWQTHVWHRFHHPDLSELVECSHRYVSRHHAHTAVRRESAPDRRPFPSDWRLDLQAHPSGQMIYLRRTDDHGQVHLLGRRFLVTTDWTHRLVRCQVHLDEGLIRFYALRRREPLSQPLLGESDYRLPRRSFRE